MCGISFFSRVISIFHCSRMVVSDDDGLEIDRFKFKDVETVYLVCPFKMPSITVRRSSANALENRPSQKQKSSTNHPFSGSSS